MKSTCKNNIEIYIMHFGNPDKISLTTDPGDIFDIEYFVKTIKKYEHPNDLVKDLKRNNINPYIYNDVLCFKTVADANDAIRTIYSKIKNSYREKIVV